MLNLKKLLAKLANNQKFSSYLLSNSANTNLLYSIAVKRIGRIATLPIAGFKNLTPSAWTDVCTLPTEYAPVGSNIETIIPLQAANGTTAVLVSVQTSGVVKVYNYTSNTGNLGLTATITYICNGG